MPIYSTSALNWLSLLLEERFGHAFMLEQGSSGLKLSLVNVAQDYILFPKLEKAFHLSRTDFSCSEWDAAKAGWISVLEQPLPAPGVSWLPEPLIEHQQDHAVIHYDILGLTYWMLNRIEEIGCTDLDIHERFPAVNSHACKHGYLERPIVDEWLHILGQVMQRQWPKMLLKKHQFSMKVSHDVDSPSIYTFKPWKTVLRMMAGHLLKRRDLKAFFAAPYIKLTSGKRLSKHDPHNTFEWLMDVSEQHGLQSAFYFICGRTYPDYDADYDLEQPIIRQLMRRIHERGHEVGLHPSYLTYQKTELIKQEADRLKRIANEEGIEQTQWGGRMHYLRWEHPITLQAWNDAGMSYDTTLSYADRPGFRCGTCFEYQAFNPVTQKILDIRIRPLIAMECTVIDSVYLGLGITDNAQNKFLELKDKCRKLGGCFTLLWHNSYFDEQKTFKQMYKRCIEG